VSEQQAPKRAPWPAVLGTAFLGALFAAFYQSEDGGRFRAEVYLDGRGIPTACGGLTSAATKPIGVEIKLGQTYTRERCQELGYRIAQRFSDTIRPHVRVPVAMREVFAYLHFAWNIGPDAFIRSTLLRKLNAGDYRGACDQILVWVYSDGKDCRKAGSNCRGIPIRRAGEHAICIGKVAIPGLPDLPLGI
jgi:lysozyme